jgi:signal peptidase II
LKKIINYASLFLMAGVIIALDQWTKMLVRVLPLGDTWLPAGLEWLLPYARIVHWYNTGAAFGSFAGYGWVFTILAFVVVGLIIYYYPQVDDGDWWLKLAMGMQMGGALGNVVDRLTNNGQVTDFISVGNFAVFNVADASISSGVVVLLIGVWFKEMNERKNTAVKASALPDQDQASMIVEGQGSEPAGNAGETAGE